MLSVYVFSDGNVATEVFKAVSAFVYSSQSGFASCLSIASIVSVLGATWQYMKGHDLMTFAKWFGIYLAVMAVLIGVRVPVQIIDVSNPMATTGAVDHVPYGIAMPAHLISTLGYGLTEGIQDVFHTPDDFDYTQTGMLYGAKLFYAANQTSRVMGAGTKSEMNDFVRQCIIPDIIINQKYSLTQLSNSDNILSFLGQQKLSPLRGLMIKNTFYTCQQAFPLLQKSLQAQIPKQTGWLGRLLFGSNQQKAQQELLPNIQSTYQYFLSMSGSAQSQLMQNTMINAIRSGIGTNFARSNSAAAMINYGYTSAMQKQMLADFTLARFSTYMMPLMQTTLFLVLVSCFPLIILLSIQPAFFMRILSKMLSSMFFLYTWPIMFTVINFMMTTKLSSYLSGIAIAAGGITLSNQNALVHEATQYAAYCGYLMLLVPLLAVGIFKGFDTVFMNSAQTFFGTIQNWSSQAAGQLAEGNIQMGNVGLGNHSWNNWHANKHDTNVTQMHGMSSAQLANGSVITQTASGGTIINTQPGTSQLATALHGSERVVSSLNHSAAQAAQLGHQHRVSADHGISEAVNQFHHLNQSWSQDDRMGVGHSQSVTDSVGQDMRQMQDAVTQYNTHHSHGHQVSLNAAVTAGFNTGNNAIGEIGKWITGVSAGGSINAANNKSTSAYSQKFLNSSEGKSFSQSLNHLVSHAQSEHADHSNSHNLSETQQIAANLSKARSEMQQSSLDYSKSQSYQQSASFAKDNAHSIDQNLAQPFVNWVQQNHGESGVSTLASTDDAGLAQQAQLAQSYWQSTSGQHAVSSEVDSILDRSSSGDLHQQFQQGRANFQSQPLNQAYTHNNHTIQSAAQTQGMTDSLKNRLDHADDQLAREAVSFKKQHTLGRVNAVAQNVAETKCEINQTRASLKNQYDDKTLSGHRKISISTSLHDLIKEKKDEQSKY
jgi:conjugal transfer mating pair stabilization protein TraG